LTFTLKIREDENPLESQHVLKEDMGTWGGISRAFFFPGDKTSMKVENLKILTSP